MKKFWLLASAATAANIAITYGPDVLISEADAGQNTVTKFAFGPELSGVPGGFNTTIRNYLTSSVCPAAELLYGSGTCDPDTGCYVVKLRQCPERGQDSVDGHIELQTFTTVRPPAAPAPPP